MVQLCLLGLYLGIETAPSDGKERHGIETVKIGPFFFLVLMLSLQKSAKELSWLVLPDGFFFIFFKLTLQNFFIMSKGT